MKQYDCYMYPSISVQELILAGSLLSLRLACIRSDSMCTFYTMKPVLQRYTDVLVNCGIFCHNMNIDIITT